MALSELSVSIFVIQHSDNCCTSKTFLETDIFRVLNKSVEVLNK